MLCPFGCTLSGVRVTGVRVDSVERLEVSRQRIGPGVGGRRCRHCGFRCYRVWDRRPKRVRDLGVSGRRTCQLVWRGVAGSNVGTVGNGTLRTMPCSAPGSPAGSLVV